MKSLRLLLLFGLYSLLAADTLTLSDTAGWDIYQVGGYHYGPSILIHPDTTIEIWTTMPGGSAWDFIHYKKSADKGKTWTGETIALKPTPGTDDALSTADPGVIKLDSFYYIGYTSTLNSRGIDNEVYVARSKSPTGPFEKWNGNGWGGNPKSFIKYDGPPGYGAGEPSFVRKGETIYIYYTWTEDVKNETRVAVAPANDPNWPGKVTLKGTAIVRSGTGGSGGYVILEDSHDIKYCDSLGLFVAVSVMNRLKANASIRFYYSFDGFHFQMGKTTNASVQPYAHNIGLSGTLDGHIDLRYPMFIGYAYGPNWADWNTYLSPVRIIGDISTLADSVPTNLNVDSVSDHKVSLSWNGHGASSFVVFRDSVSIGTTTKPFFSDLNALDSTTYSYQIASLTAIGMMSEKSIALKITTLKDVTVPQILSVVTDPSDSGKIILEFNEPLDPASANNTSHYQLSPSVSITSAQLQSNSKTVLLTVHWLTDSYYILTINGVTDLAEQPHIMNQSIPFIYQPNILSNIGFEKPVISSLQYNPVDLSWLFSGTCGIQRNGSAFGAATAPEGKQTAFLQKSNCSITQSFICRSGKIGVSFKAAQRSSNRQTINVYIDSVLFGAFTPASNLFESVVTNELAISSGSHQLKFEGMKADGDNTAFIDSISINFTPGGTGTVDPTINSLTRESISVIPNPFNPCAILKFKILNSGTVALKIFNINGRQVYSDIRNLQKGLHSVKRTAQSTNGSKLPGGLYFLQLATKDGTLTERLILVR